MCPLPVPKIPFSSLDASTSSETEEILNELFGESSSTGAPEAESTTESEESLPPDPYVEPPQRAAVPLPVVSILSNIFSDQVTNAQLNLSFHSF